MEGTLAERSKLISHASASLLRIRPYTGFQIVANRPSNSLLVADVLANGPAAHAGFRPGDVILCAYPVTRVGPGVSSRQGAAGDGYMGGPARAQADAKTFRDMLPGDKMRFIIERNGTQHALLFDIPSKKYGYESLLQMGRIAQRVIITPEDYRLFPGGHLKVPVGKSPRLVLGRSSRTPKNKQKSYESPQIRPVRNLVFSDMSPHMR